MANTGDSGVGTISFTDGLTAGGVVSLIGAILFFARTRDASANTATGAANKLLLARVIELEKQQATFLTQIAQLQAELSQAKQLIVQQKGIIDRLTHEYREAVAMIKQLQKKD